MSGYAYRPSGNPLKKKQAPSQVVLVQQHFHEESNQSSGDKQVVEVPTYLDLPTVGTPEVIYITLDDNYSYRYSETEGYIGFTTGVDGADNQFRYVSQDYTTSPGIVLLEDPNAATEVYGEEGVTYLINIPSTVVELFGASINGIALTSSLLDDDLQEIYLSGNKSYLITFSGDKMAWSVVGYETPTTPTAASPSKFRYVSQDYTTSPGYVLLSDPDLTTSGVPEVGVMYLLNAPSSVSGLSGVSVNGVPGISAIYDYDGQDVGLPGNRSWIVTYNVGGRWNLVNNELDATQHTHTLAQLGDSNITSPAENDTVQRKSGYRVNRTPQQLKQDFGHMGNTCFLGNAVSSIYKIVPFAVNATTPVTGTIGKNSIMYIPFCLSKTMTITKLGFSVSTGVAANSVVALYDSSSDRPSTKIVDTGLVSTAVAGYKSTTIASTTLEAGKIYWIAHLSSEGISLRCLGTAGVSSMLGFSTTGLQSVSHYYASIAVGRSAIPSTAGTLTTGTGTVPLLYIE